MSRKREIKFPQLGAAARATLKAPPLRILNYVDNLYVVDDAEVIDFFVNDFPLEQFFCSFQFTGAICSGDSGVPIVNEDGELVRAPSFQGQLCEDTPSCYTSVVYFAEWLRTNADVDI